MFGKFFSELMAQTVTVKTVIILCLFISLVFVVAMLIVATIKDNRLKMAKREIAELRRVRHINPGETAAPNVICLSLEDEIFLREDDDQPICQVRDWVGSNFPDISFSELTIPARAYSVSGRVCVQGSKGLVWIELSNPKSVYTVKVETDKSLN